MTEERRREIQAEIDERMNLFRERKERRERGEPVEVLQKTFFEKGMVHPNGFQINPERFAMMTEEERKKEQKRIDDLNRRLKIHNEHRDAIRRNHMNPKSIEDAILTEEESKWLQEDDVVCI